MPTSSLAESGSTHGRVRIAIFSPEILARIRHEFASKGLDVQIAGPPAVDVVVTPGAGATVHGAFGAALHGLAGPQTRQRDPATARYRLALISQGGQSPAADSGSDGVLSRREVEVMDLVGRGLANTDIAAQLRIRPKTVKNHVNSIFTKLGARNRVEAVLIWHSDQGGRRAGG